MAAPKGNKFAKGNSGRPPNPDKKSIQDAICRLVTTTTLSLRKIVEELSKKIDNMPERATIMLWLAEDKDFSDQYARAKEHQCDLMAEELIEISDDDSLDMAFTEEGKQYIDKEHINRSRLRVDTRKWILCKLKPKKYGEKIGVEHSGEVGLTVNLIDKFEVKG